MSQSISREMSITYRRCFPFPFVVKYSYCIVFR